MVYIINGSVVVSPWQQTNSSATRPTPHKVDAKHREQVKLKKQREREGERERETPFIQCRVARGGQNVSPLGERQDTPWTGRQLIMGPHKDK